ncbi:MAG: sensor domain-containing diguanylate cyclase [Candidatus Hydrogenedentota bacterium]|nr:MAG: sensor domain-containing diguanylate cyclase [Candidatus Hydrogenedentota bacterium]
MAEPKEAELKPTDENEITVPLEYFQYESRIFALQELLTISKALTSNLDSRSLIETILSISLTHSQTFKVGIYLSPQLDSNFFQLYDTSIGFDVNHPEQFRLAKESDFIRYLENIEKTTTLTEAKKAIPNTPENNAIFEKLSSLSDELLLVPLKKSGDINGLLILGPKSSGGQYTASECAFLANLASIASIAVENAKLYEMATVDMKTKLRMHHYFMARLREEMRDASKSDKPLSMLMLDIDHFKKFNDTYGHQLGDVVLQQVAAVLMRNCRSTDVPARYGGEEFAVLMPGARLTDTVKQAERTRKAIENMEIENPQDPNHPLHVTVSIGIAQFYPDLDTTPEHFIERCDQALYKAKQAGRNRIEAATVQHSHNI